MLTALGQLTRVVYLEGKRKRVLRWGLRRAPILAYDEAGKLRIVYGPKPRRDATAEERRRYTRTHWGLPGRGEVADAEVASAPFERLGPVVEITYTTEKGGDSAPTDYVHEIGEGAKGAWTPVWLVAHRCASARCAGRGKFALSGGSARVTDRGIVG